MIALLLARMTNQNPKPPESCSAPVATLDRVRSRQKVEVLKITGTRDEANSLAQLGIRVGEVLSVKRSAPLGGAVLVETGDRTVALGRALAGKVRVRIRA
jgi:Fe2+ transport system protein FeoA